MKYDASNFCEQVVGGLNAAGGSLEDVSQYLDQAGSTKDYRRYAEPLFDILLAGGMLAPGGKRETRPRFELCVFNAEPMVEALREYLRVFVHLVRRYKYLQKSLDEEMRKILKFLKAFSDQERRSLAIFTGLCLAEPLIPATAIGSLMTSEILVKEGLSLEFSTAMFQTWINEKGIAHIGSVLRKATLEKRLLELLPPQRQTADHFNAHFSQAGLEPLVKFRQAQENASFKKKLREELEGLFEHDALAEEIVELCQQHMASTSLTDVDVTVMLWRCIMGSVEWNKKQELVAEQALKHLKAYTGLFLPFCERGTPQLTLLIKMQEFCYDRMNFMKVFHKIVLLFYKNDVLTEQAILKWYSDAHVAKGKSVFLVQMKPMVDWLQTAEEESDTEQPTDKTALAPDDT